MDYYPFKRALAPIRILAPVLCLIAVSPGCMLGPDYSRPALSPPSAWRTDIPQPESAANLAWWEQLGDSELDTLLKAALAESKDLHAAAARIDQFYAAYGISRAELFPHSGISADYSRFRSSGEAKPFGMNVTANDFKAALGLSWELDLWGRIRRANEAALADLLTQEAARRGVVLTLVSSLARLYVELRTLDRQLEIAQQTVTNREEWVSYARTRFQGGLVSELDVIQAEAELAKTQASVPQLESLIAQKENQLSELIGRNPGPVARGRTVEELGKTAVIPSGVPSDVLQNRPDVVAAEQQLVSANALIGVAKSEYFPQISLTGLFGYESAELRSLFSGPARMWSFGPALSEPLFTAGRLGYQVEAAEAKAQEALSSYEKTIQTAFREIEDSLIGHKKSLELMVIRDRQLKIAQRYLEFANQRYNEGLTYYLEVLDAQRSLFNAELEQVQSQGNRVMTVIEVYRAMGGGWVAEAANYCPAQMLPRHSGAH